VAKQLGENTKNPAFTNLAYAGASHFARITKSSIAKLLHLLWQQNTLLELPNPALSNLVITLAAKHLTENNKNLAFIVVAKHLA